MFNEFILGLNEIRVTLNPLYSNIKKIQNKVSA